MSSISTLRQLALAATPGPWEVNKLGYSATYVVSNFVEPSVGAAYYAEDADYIAACSPDVILRLLACVEAADAMREWMGETFQHEVDANAAYDAALAALDAGKEV